MFNKTKFIVYGQQQCNFCTNALEMLKDFNENVEYYDITDDPTLKSFVKSIRSTVPLIVKVETPWFGFGTQDQAIVGGYQELKQYYLNNKRTPKYFSGIWKVSGSQKDDAWRGAL